MIQIHMNKENVHNNIVQSALSYESKRKKGKKYFIVASSMPFVTGVNQKFARWLAVF